jgi:His/Glu/Gln/Arg/opine family amino acid ABC transporter permease subunit
VWLAIFAVLGFLFWSASFDNAWIREHIGFIARGLLWTLIMAAGGIVLAIALALVGALGRLSRNPIAYGLSGFYTSFFRGTPLIVQLFLFYLAMPQTAQNLVDKFPNFLPTSFDDFFTWSSFQVGIVVLGLNYGAYMTEIFRAGIQSVSHGQAEAADALGMTYRSSGATAGVPSGDPADRERVHRDDEGHGTDLHPGPGDREDGALPPRSTPGKCGREADGGARHGRRALLGPDRGLHVLPEPSGTPCEQGIRADGHDGLEGPGAAEGDRDRHRRQRPGRGERVRAGRCR